MKGHTQEQSGRKQPSDSAGSRPTQPSVRNEAHLLEVEVVQQKDQETEASMDAQSKAMSDMDHTRVAELAYRLYEQHGRRDGHDREDWFNAEQHIMTQGRRNNSGL
jgi:hypothetical protein